MSLGWTTKVDDRLLWFNIEDGLGVEDEASQLFYTRWE